MSTTRLLTAIALLQAMTLLTLWKGGDALSTPVHASVPEPGIDRREMVAELKAANEKLAGMLKLMESGKLQVEVAPADEKKGR